jgi:hypothetical protein
MVPGFDADNPALANIAAVFDRILAAKRSQDASLSRVNLRFQKEYICVTRILLHACPTVFFTSSYEQCGRDGFLLR